jgi:Na+/melibiose symporter-like transporter
MHAGRPPPPGSVAVPATQARFAVFLSKECRCRASRKGKSVMGTILIIVLVILLLGGFGGYHGYNRYGGTGLGGVLGLVLIVLLVLWLAGGLHA